MSRDEHIEILRAARELDPTKRGFIAELSRRTGINRQRLKKLWEEGDPKRDIDALKHTMAVGTPDVRELRAAPPEEAEQVIEQVAARTAVPGDDHPAHADAIRTAREEAELIANARRTGIALSRQIEQLAETMLPIIEHTSRAMFEDFQARAESGEVNVAEEFESATNQLIKTGSMAKTIFDSLDKLLKAERLRVGEPTDVISVQSDISDPEVIAAKAAEMSAAITRMLKRGKSDGDI